jgi:predicted ATPase
LFELRAAASLARLLVEAGRRHEGKELLGRIYSWFTEGFEAADLKEARALLSELA